MLEAQAKSLASRAYQPPSSNLPESLRSIQWDEMQRIQFRRDHALWHGLDAPLQVRFFHLGLFNKTPVQMYEIVGGQAREFPFDPALFHYDGSGVDSSALPRTLGYAGFQLALTSDLTHDIAAFQGASYFRAVGSEGQYGISARGLAIDCGLPKPEEFPIFTKFWFERPASQAKSLTVYALLDSPSVAGAYRFVITPGEPLLIDIEATLYPRTTIEHIGIAPLTSMYLCGENDRRLATDFRPEIHDSDGLAIHTGSDEWLWRPLLDPTAVRTSWFSDSNPRGFGLVQRDRNFDHYQDDGAFYNRRPCVWVEPRTVASKQHVFGKGAVQLVEIPTPDETFDNIVAFWQPADPPKKGDELRMAYRLSWGSTAPEPSNLATVRATRTGLGGVVGQPRKYFSWRFAVDFAGGELDKLPANAVVEPVITASRGEIEITSARPLVAINGRRALFDLKPTDDSVQPIELRLFLRSEGKALSETWLYQWTPPPLQERKF
ncbi:MAG TPA: glucan biosynthesis protein D [Pirellulales bacterium]|nr:glucan biosynthesis protein D [Pirellulales bacterium]